MTVGCTLRHEGALATPDALRTLARRAEELGFDHLWVGDHLVRPVQITSPYPYSASGAFGDERPFCEALTMLSHLAGCTQNIKLGTFVLILPYREPIFTAKIISTLDYLSGGRVILGVGVGWMEEEFLALGFDTFRQRGAVTDEHIRIYKELWTQDDPQFQGRFSQFSGFKFSPKPVQKPHPPIWVGGHSAAAIKRAATLGDGWLPVGLRPPAGLEPEEMADLVDLLRDTSEAAGRPREVVDVVFSATVSFDSPSGGARRTLTGSAEAIGADIVLYQQVGVEHFVFSFQGDEVEQVLENMERFAKEVRPGIA